ncbi:hypothetical protein, partial [Brevibacillus laterosporus]
ELVGWFREEMLVRATDEEVAEAQRQVARENIKPGVYVKLTVATEEEAAAEVERQQALDQFKPGDKVRLVNGGGKLPLHGFENGGIYTVGLREDDAIVTIKRQDGKKGYAKPDQLEKVTDE